jgi:CO/xanthine dehydrogenase Mo-binding subunit
VDNVLLVDRKIGKFQAMTGKFKNDGGRQNFSVRVGVVGTTAAQSIYYLAKSDFSVAILASRAVDAGSTRGFGTLQFGDRDDVAEAAEILTMDAIDLRLQNVLKTGMKNTQGAIPSGALRHEEILLRAKQHPLWANRQQKRLAFEAANPGKK